MKIAKDNQSRLPRYKDKNKSRKNRAMDITRAAKIIQNEYLYDLKRDTVEVSAKVNTEINVKEKEVTRSALLVSPSKEKIEVHLVDSNVFVP